MHKFGYRSLKESAIIIIFKNIKLSGIPAGYIIFMSVYSTQKWQSKRYKQEARHPCAL